MASFSPPVVDTLNIVAPSYTNLPQLKNVREIYSHKTKLTHITGFFGKMRVTIYEDQTIIVRGSMPTFLFGSNVKTMSFPELVEALKMLSDIFGIKPHEARVRRIDISATMEMNYNVWNYLNLLGYAPFYEKYSYGRSGVKYIQKNKVILVYDKGKKENVPGNLLRCEVQFQKQLKRLGIGDLYISDLFSHVTCTKMVNKWIKEYKRIDKYRKHMFQQVATPKKCETMLARLYLSELSDIQPLIDDVKTWELDKYKRRDIIRKIRELALSGNCEKSEALIKELDERVLQSASYMLSR